MDLYKTPASNTNIPNFSPLVSVVIPGYKNQYIRQSIESVLQQTYTNFEIVVVDDGSPFHLQELLQDYIQQKKIRYFYQENKKMAAARNAGIRYAQGELIAFLDDDDLWLPTKLEKQVPLFADPSVGISYTWASKFYDNDLQHLQETRINSIQTSLYLAEELLLGNLYFPNSSVMIRKVCIEQAGYFNETPEYYGIDDSDLWIRICLHYQARGVPERLLLYRIHSSQASRNMIPILLRAIQMRSSYIQKLGLGKKLLYKQLAQSYDMLAYEYIDQYNKTGALLCYLKAMFYQPQMRFLLAILKLSIPFRIKLLLKRILKIP